MKGVWRRMLGAAMILAIAGGLLSSASGSAGSQRGLVRGCFTGQQPLNPNDPTRVFYQATAACRAGDHPWTISTSPVLGSAFCPDPPICVDSTLSPRQTHGGR